MLKLLLSSVVLSLVGCESMEPSGNLFQPATDAAVADMGGATDASALKSDFPAEVSFSISSEELSGSTGDAPTDPPTEATEDPGQD
ncbi:MAG: hypothetical protein QGG40_01945, partial [Myxococcota bacterium]|nr:hypothetical protein [Myxococcota bacterium]